MAPKLKLSYFPLEGRGEIIRILCAIGGLPLEDEVIPFMSWKDVKSSTPYLTLPVLTVDGKTQIGQTLAAARYVAKLSGLTGSSPEDEGLIDAAVDFGNEMFNEYKMIWAPTVMNTTMEDFKKLAVMRVGEDAKKYENNPASKAEAYQEYAAKSVNPHLDVYEKLLENNGNGWLVGKKMSWADVYLAEFMNRLVSHVEPTALDKHPKVKALKEKVYGLPQVLEFKKKCANYEF